MGVFVVSLVLVLAVTGYRFWQAHQASDPLRRLGPAMYQPRSNSVGETLPLPPLNPH